jgi:CxxC motif-containing protein (DUF1111 family)
MQPHPHGAWPVNISSPGGQVSEIAAHVAGFCDTYETQGSFESGQVSVLTHDGQGRRARDAFAALPPDSKAKLLAFLASL